MRAAISLFFEKAGRVASASPLVLAAAGAICLAVLPLLIVDMPPLFDLPAHMARLAVLLDQGATPQLNAMFDIRWAPLPNLAFELVTLPLARVMSLGPSSCPRCCCSLPERRCFQRRSTGG